VNSFTGDPTHGRLGTAAADLNGDGKLDVVQSQGEVAGSFDERVFLGKNLKRDMAPPIIALVETSLLGDAFRGLVMCRNLYLFLCTAKGMLIFVGQ
jgi:hypothetical protein